MSFLYNPTPYQRSDCHEWINHEFGSDKTCLSRDHYLCDFGTVENLELILKKMLIYSTMIIVSSNNLREYIQTKTLFAKVFFEETPGPLVCGEVYVFPYCSGYWILKNVCSSLVVTLKVNGKISNLYLLFERNLNKRNGIRAYSYLNFRQPNFQYLFI